MIEYLKNTSKHYNVKKYIEMKNEKIPIGKTLKFHYMYYINFWGRRFQVSLKKSYLINLSRNNVIIILFI